MKVCESDKYIVKLSLTAVVINRDNPRQYLPWPKAVWDSTQPDPNPKLSQTVLSLTQS